MSDASMSAEDVAHLFGQSSAWRSIDTAPKDMPVIVYGTHQRDYYRPPHIDPYIFIAEYLEVSGEDGVYAWYVCGTGDEETWVYQPTHWMPLPTPPYQEWD